MLEYFLLNAGFPLLIQYFFFYKYHWRIPHTVLLATSSTISAAYTYKCITVENRCTGRFLCSRRQEDYLWGAGTLRADYSSWVWSNLRLQSDQATIGLQREARRGREGRVIGCNGYTKSGEKDEDIRTKGQTWRDIKQWSAMVIEGWRDTEKMMEGCEAGNSKQREDARRCHRFKNDKEREGCKRKREREEKGGK